MALEYKYVQQRGAYISGFIKADPDVKKYSALFDEDRVIVCADDKFVWRFYVHDKIIPNKCELIVTANHRVEVKLAKRKAEVYWRTLQDEKKANQAVKPTKEAVHVVADNPNYKPEPSEPNPSYGSHNRETNDPNPVVEYKSVRERAKFFSDDGVVPKPGSNISKSSTANNQPPPNSKTNYIPNPRNVAPSDHPLSEGVRSMSSNPYLVWKSPLPDPQSFVLVEFHCLLSVEVWGFDESSGIGIYFGHHKQLYGPMTRIQSYDDYQELSCTLQIPLQLFEEHASCRRYKYYVETPKVKGKAIKPFEFICGPETKTGKIIDRSLNLQVDVEKLECGSLYKQYDGIIWPEILDDKVGNESLWTRAKQWVGWKTPKSAISTPNEEDTSLHSGNIQLFGPKDHVEFRKAALICYLYELVNDFAGIAERNHPIQLIKMVYVVYASMSCSYLYYDKSEQKWVCKEIAEEMYQLLLNITKCLFINSDPNHSYLIEVVILLTIYLKCTLLDRFSADIGNRDLIIALLRNLAIHDSTYREACNRLDKESVLQVLDIVIVNTTEFMPPVTEWIFAVPLMHLLSEQCQPFGVLQSISWDFSKLADQYQWGAIAVLQATALYPFPDSYLEELQPLFKIDPLLLRLFVHRTPLNQLFTLFGKVPASVLLMRLAQEFQEFQEPKKHHHILQMLTISIDKLTETPLDSNEEEVAVVKCSLYLLKTILDSIKMPDVDSIMLMIKFVVCAASKTISRSDVQELNEMITKRLEEYLWKMNNKVYHLNAFDVNNKQKLNNQVQHWIKIVKLGGASCQLWETVVKTVFVKHFSSPHKPDVAIVILKEMDANKAPAVLIDCTFEYISVRIDKLREMEIAQLLKGLQKLTSPSLSSKTLFLLDKILCRKYPSSKHISIQEILKWEPGQDLIWSDVLICCVNTCSIQRKEDLKSASELAYAALTTFIQYCHSIVNESITIQELAKCYKEKEKNKLKLLCNGANSGKTKFCPDFSEISKKMSSSFQKYNEVKYSLERIQVVVTYCSLISKELTQKVSIEMSKTKDSLHDKKVSELVVPDYKIPLEMLEKFIIFGEQHQSEWFDLQWKQKVDCLAPKDAEITFNWIYENIWKPVISNCLSFLNRLFTKSLPLSAIRTLTAQNLYNQLEPLCLALQKCYRSEISFHEEYKWIKEVIKHIKVYQKFVNNPENIDALNICLKLKESLQLKGDFSDITIVYKHLTASEDKVVLADVSEKNLERCATMTKVYNNAAIQAFFKVFIASRALVEWIREVTNNFEQLECYINVCKTIVESADLISLSNLHKVGESFSKLIYSSVDNVGFNEFNNMCNSVRTTIQRDPKLTDCLKNCAEKINWYKRLKEGIGVFNFDKKKPLLYSPPEITNKEYIILDFYCLVSIKQWGFTQSSNVFLRFGAKDLGTFSTCHGPMTRTHNRDEGNYLELHLTVKIPINILKNSDAKVRTYRYHVESSATENDTLESLEYISGPRSSSGVINRSLELHVDHYKIGSLYKRFDGIILPEHIHPPPIKAGQSLITATLNYVRGSSQASPTTCDGEKLDSPNYSTKRLTDLHHQELRKKGIHMHLEDIKSMLLGKTTIEKLIDCVDIVYAVYMCLKNYYLFYGNKEHEWNFAKIEQEMEGWLRQLVISLLDNFKNIPRKFVLQIVLSLLIIYSKLKFLVSFCCKKENKHLVTSLLHYLIIDESSFENSVKPLWNFFDNLPNLILTFVKTAISLSPPLSEWIFTIPLLHLLNKECEPYEILHCIEWDHVGILKHKYQWGDDSLLPSKELQKSCGKQIMVDQSYLQEIQSLFKFDPLLRRLFVKRTAMNNLKDLVHVVPTDILIMRMAEDVLKEPQLSKEAEKGKKETEKEKKETEKDIIELLLRNKSFSSESDDDIAIVKSSLHLFKAICNSEKPKVNINIVIRLVLIALSQLFGNKSVLENEVENAKVKATNLLKEIMYNITTKTCGKNAFIVNSHSERQSEMQHWTQMFKIECDDGIKDYWHSVCNEVIISRLTVIEKPAKVVKIVLEIDDEKITHEKVVNCVIDHLIEGVQQVDQHDVDQTTEFEKLMDKKPCLAEKFLSLHSNFLSNKYPSFITSEHFPITELLTGHLWSNVIKFFVKGCALIKQKNSLEVDDLKETSEIVHAALQKLIKLHIDIKTGAVTGNEVKSYRSKVDNLQCLCEAARIVSSVPRYDEIVSAMEVCYKKVNIVKEYRLRLTVVVDYSKYISKDLTEDICKEISDNSDDKLYDKKISTLCDDSYKCICFPSATMENEMIQNFITCGKCNDDLNKIFEYCWNQQAINIQDDKDVSFDSIYNLVWKKTIEQCQQVLLELKNRSVTLEETETLCQLFTAKSQIVTPNENPGQCQIECFSSQLTALCEAMHQCYPSSKDLFPLPNEWIPDTISYIALYNEVVNDTKCTEAATVILKVKVSLKLNGDFQIVENLANCTNTDFKKRKLGDIDVRRWMKIKDMYSSQQLFNCLDVFSGNTRLVFWLREATNDVSQLASFVEVCNSSAGEEEFNMKRLSYLHSVGTNFASLIYDLPDDANFDKFDEKCKTVESLLENNPKLADSLVECTNHLDWFVELRETQGSFEVSAISKVKDINQCGEYKISSTEETPLLFIGDAIKLKIHRFNAVKQEYSLDDLRDLESKLVLITGKHTAEKAKTEIFLNHLHLVCRIANALLALRNAGHAKYITWSYSFHCKCDRYDELENQAMKMEKELKRWSDEIVKSRNNFPVLNLFTTQQLRVVRQQLGQLNCERISSLPPAVISMLMSLSPKICEKDIKECLHSVKSKNSLVGKHSVEKLKKSDDMSNSVDNDKNVQISQFNPDNAESAVKKLVLELISQLNDVEKNAYEELKDEYPDEIVYLSIKRCSNSSMEQETLTEDAYDWCLDNENFYVGKDPGELLNELQELNAHGSKIEQNTQHKDNSTPILQSKDKKIYLVEQMLTENDIPSGLAREAAETYPDDPEEALSYCLDEQNKSSDQSFLQLPPTGESRKDPYKEHYDKVKVNEYMSLDELAKVLEELVNKFSDRLTIPRNFNDSFFIVGEPNLILVPSGKVLKTALSLYCEHNQPFPSMDEVVICTSETTTEDVVLLWRRAIWDPGYKQVFCLLFAEKMSYKVCDESLAELDKLSQGKKDYRIVIICSSESEETSHVVSKLLQFKRDYAVFPKDKEISDYLKHHFKSDNIQSAADIDPEKLSVRVVSSEKPGMGKSLHVKKLAEKLKDKDSYCIVPIHGPVVDFNTVMKLLQPFTPSYEALKPQIIHMDIDSEVLSVIDTIIFSLLILKSLKDKNGNVWRFVSSQLYMIEVTCCKIDTMKTQQESSMSLLQLLPSIKCVGPEDSLKPNQSEVVIIDKNEFKNKVFQCVFQYLRRYDAKADLSNFIYQEPSVEGDYSTCISTITKLCSITHPSWAELAQFVRFLNVQLNDCQSSIYCYQEFFAAGTDFKKFVVEFMIRMSQDFAMRSLKIVDDDNAKADAVDQYQIRAERHWDESHHPYIFFNQDHMTMTFVGFKVDDKGQCLDFKSKNPIKGCCVPLPICECLAIQGVNLQKEDCNTWTKKDMIERLCRVFGVDYAEDPDESYVLTSDNFLKMMAIHMRFRCDIPVVIMGETGCGKTRLIRYMCNLQTWDSGVKNLVMLKVHGGTTEEDITKAVVATEELSERNCQVDSKLYTILFFDEANTTENIGLIKEIMCDRRLKGRKINDHVKFIAACNPYRKHTNEMIKKLETAGLGYYVKSDNTQHKFGNIPLRHLVYRVLDLPLSMQPLLYDFGQVTGKTEKEYIRQIVANHVQGSKLLLKHPKDTSAAVNPDEGILIKNITELLAASQSFMRTKMDECSFVSLRDVERAMIVFEWFYENSEFFEELLKTNSGSIYQDTNTETRQDTNREVRQGTNRETRSIILTLAVCYHARIQERENFEKYICDKFNPSITEEKFCREISNFQSMILSQLNSNIPNNIARNVALKENVFMMLVCIELKIPLFVIGKPGSSKSLAKSIVANSMQGPSSSNALCKKLKQVKLFSYQCSQHSTPSSILEVFNNAKKFQETKDKQLASSDRKNTKQFVSVVVLDEVGLAEDSPSLPLKALHPLLEDGTSGADAKEQYIAREDRVAFVGISNWALDPAKMNRGVMITRGSPDEKQLKESAQGICSNEEKDPIKNKLDEYFIPLSKAYMEICEKQTREFFGLRDFYSLIKMLYWMISKTKSLTRKQLVHAIQRNFDGLDEFNTTEIFLTHIAHIDSDEQQTSASTENKQTATAVEDKQTDMPIANEQIDTSILNEAEQTAFPTVEKQTDKSYANGQTDASISGEIEQTISSATEKQADTSNENDTSISSEIEQTVFSTVEKQTDAPNANVQTDTSSEIEQIASSTVEKQTDTSNENGQTSTSVSSETEQIASSVENEQTSTLKPLKEKATYTDIEPLELIKASLNTKDISWHGESRYLLFMTENFAALRVLQQHLLRGEDEPPFVLFGSSFPKDMEYTQVCRNINQIKICMETGRTVILLNLENLYESLYDVLNQYYTKLRENRYVDLGLQSHRIKCRVADDFKMILIAEKETVYKDFPTPLINRLEKHFVVTSTILTGSQKEIVNRLIKWAKDFTTITKFDNINRLQLGDAFVGYQEDTPAAVIFQAYHHLKATEQWEIDDEMSKGQKDQIFEKGKSLLLDIASPDAIVRLRYSKLASEFDAAYNMYFIEQSHSSLSELLSSKLPMLLDGPSTDEGIGFSASLQEEILLLQITTHSHLLSEPDVTQLCKALKLQRKNITWFMLQEFDTEMDFCNKLKMVIEEEIVGHKILIIQCDCGHLHSNLIACARHKVIDEIVVPQSSSKGRKSEDKSKETVPEESLSNKTVSEDIPFPHSETTTEDTQSPSKQIISEDMQSSVQERMFKNNEETESKSDSNKNRKSRVHVVFIVQLPRKAGGTNFVGFQGGDWLSVHLDDLRPLKENELSFQTAIQCSISEIFNAMYHTITSETSLKELESASLHHNKLQSVTFNANRRLRDLIQMACSWLYDTEQNRERTTKRISILTDLIPTESTKDKSNFDCRLVQFVTGVLKEIDDINPEAKDWVFEEALKHAHISGTFRNALSRRLDKILLPILAKIIALIDKNFNLTIIHDHHDNIKISSPIARLWLEIFSEKTLCRITYEDIFSTHNVAKTKKWIPGIGATLSEKFYKCSFPFSWICREVINAQKRDSAILAVRSMSKRSNVKHVEKMSELLESSPLGTILKSCVPDDNLEAHKQLCCLYLNDYIISTYRTDMVEEQQIIYEAVYSRFNQSTTESSTFLEKLVMLHIAYAELEPQLQQFKQLVSLSPGIVFSVIKKLDEDSDFKNEISDLALCTVKLLLNDLTHDKNWNKDQTKQWIQNVSYYQNSINSILNIETLYDSTKARKDWMRILTLKTFAVTIGLHYNNDLTLTALKRLTFFLKDPDFKNVKILKHMTKVLVNLQDSMRGTWDLKKDDDFKNEAKQNDVKEYFEFIDCCEKYFIEIITNFCFEQTYDAKDPEPALIEYLFDCIFTSNPSTESLMTFSEHKVPVVRSYLLQLLIGLKADDAWKRLETYFDRSRHLAEGNDTDLHVLCIQCFEDKHYKSIEKTEELAQNCLNLLQTQMKEYEHVNTVALFTVKYFSSIATLRFCLSQFSDALCEWCRSKEKQQFPKEWLEVLQTVKRLFNLPKGKYPAEFFIKYIVRQHGIKLFNQLKMCEEPSFDWIIPEHLKGKEESDGNITDPTVVYCGTELFDKFLDSLAHAISSKDTTELDIAIQKMNDPQYSVMIVMAIYASVALKQSPLSHANEDVKSPKSSIMMVANHANLSLYPSPLPQVVADWLSVYVTNSDNFNCELKRITKDVLCGICRANPDVTKTQGLQSKQIHGIIIHCVTVFHQKESVEFLKPCVELLKSLSSMKNMFLPTMPEVCEVKSEFKNELEVMGTYYVCESNPNHVFLVTVECEKYDEKVKCFCQKTAIKDKSNKSMNRKATGHILGSAASRGKDQVQEEGKEEGQLLLTKHSSILRTLLHAILAWKSSFIDKSNPPDLDGCITPDVPVQSLEHFFLSNLEQDLITLSSSLGRSVDDAVLTVHLVLKQLSQMPDQDFPGCTGKWSNIDERKVWENDFGRKFIDPVLEDIEKTLKNTYALALKDANTLYSKIYEITEEKDTDKENKEKDDRYSALWRYRTRLSLEHLSHSILSKNHKILNAFLKQEGTLRAMQYLPGILKLQRYLFDHFHQQIGQEKAVYETIGEYKRTLQKDHEDEKMFTELVHIFNEAWLLLKDQLTSHGRLTVPLEYINDAPEINDEVKLAYLMPTTTGEGICSSSMVDFLVCQHNEFIKFCYGKLPKAYYDPNICQKLLQNTIPLSQLQACHVLSYEHKLIPVILTHCQYSLRYGKGTEVAYDFEAIERDLIDKFIFGKPLILIDEMPRVVLRKDAHDSTFYESIMANVPQENLQPEKKKILIDDITKLSMHRDPHRLSELLDVVEIVLGFLASAGGKPDQTFHYYIAKTLTMQRAHIPKAVRDCTLSTAISIWRIVSVVQSCKLTTLNKEPFERLNEEYCVSIEKSDLQQTFKKIESPIDFLIALHNFIAVFVSHRDPIEDCNPKWRLTEVWKEAMETSDIYPRVDFESIIISDDILMCHTAAVWKEAVGLLWPKENQQ